MPSRVDATRKAQAETTHPVAIDYAAAEAATLGFRVPAPASYKPLVNALAAGGVVIVGPRQGRRVMAAAETPRRMIVGVKLIFTRPSTSSSPASPGLQPTCATDSGFGRAALLLEGRRRDRMQASRPPFDERTHGGVRGVGV